MLNGTAFRRRALLYAGIALVIVYILWNIPQLDFLLYPFRLFVTFVHEAGHGLAAILTGGRFLQFTILPNGSGYATTAGGVQAIILPAGYLGAALFGAVLFYLANSLPYPRHISVVLGVLVIGIAFLFGGLFSLATLVGVLIGVALIAIGRRGHYDINLLTLNLLATITSLNAVLDLFGLIRSSGVRMGSIRNDALAFQQEVFPLIPAAVWAFLWSAIAVLMLGAAIYYSVIHPWRRGDGSPQ
jgi:hypothetical protein